MRHQTITILGCGVAGSWVAHQLVALGYERFTLFGGAKDSRSLRRIGPIPKAQPVHGTAAQALAKHLQRLDPSVAVTTFGDFKDDEHAQHLAGRVVGTMGTIKKCMKTGDLVRKRGLPWITLALPSTRGVKIVIGTNPKALRDGHFGPTILGRPDILIAAARAAALIDGLRL